MAHGHFCGYAGVELRPLNMPGKCCNSELTPLNASIVKTLVYITSVLRWAEDSVLIPLQNLNLRDINCWWSVIEGVRV